MNKDRRSKSLVIVALALTLIALTLGFAAFSTTLNISSNATVTPNEEDFKITVYGAKDTIAAEEFYQTSTFSEENLSPTVSIPYIGNAEETSAESATIDNATHTISNISVGLTKPGNEISYFFVIKNEGKYDAYLDLTDYTYVSENKEYIMETPITGFCSAQVGTSETLVEETCDSVVNAFGFFDTDGDVITTGESVLTIPKGKHIALASIVAYTEADTLADGPFTVAFPEVKLNFSTAK